MPATTGCGSYSGRDINDGRRWPALLVEAEMVSLTSSGHYERIPTRQAACCPHCLCRSVFSRRFSFYSFLPFSPAKFPPCLGARRPASTYRLIALLRRSLAALLRVSKDPFKLCSLHYFCKTTSTTTQLHSRFRPPFLLKGGYGHGGPYKSRCNTAISVTCC